MGGGRVLKSFHREIELPDHIGGDIGSSKDLYMYIFFSWWGLKEVLESKKKTFCKHFVWAKQLHDGIWITI